MRFLLICTLIILPNLGHSEEALEAKITQGKYHFEHGSYQKTITIFQQLLDGYQLQKREDIILVHTYLAAAYFHTSKYPLAQQHIQSLLNFDPEPKLTANYYSPKFIDFFRRVKRGEPDTLITAPLQVDTNNVKSTTAIPASTPQTIDMNLGNSSDAWGWRLMPFGVGQYYNHENLKGTLYLAGEATTLATAIAMLMLFDNEKDSNGSFADTDSANNYRTAFTASIITYGALTVMGIIDAVLVGKKQKRRQIAAR